MRRRISFLHGIVIEVSLLFLLLCHNSGFPGCNYFDLKSNVSVHIESCNVEVCKTDSNQIETLKAIFVDNPLLESVIIKTIRFSEIPREVCALKNLKVLVLQSNCLERLSPDCFTHLTNLEEISVTSNKVKVLPKYLFTGLNKLKSIALNNNEIEDFDESVLSNVSDMTSLKSIDLSENRLKSIGPWPLMRGISTYGFRADLSENEISLFKNKIGWKYECEPVNRSVKHFYSNFRGNQIHYISDFIDTFCGNIVNLKCLLGKSSHTNVSIEVGENPMWCDCKDYNLNKFLRTFNRINVMNSARCAGPQRLLNERYLTIPLELMICNFTNTPSCIDGCQCIFQPHGKQYIVDCSALSGSLSVSRLPDSLCPLEKISSMTNMGYNISFAGSNISALENREYFRSTKVLDLSYSRIRTIGDDVFESLKGAEVINLSGNLLEALPKSVMNVSLTAKQIKLQSNPWKCNCNNVWIKEWLRTRNSKVMNLESIYCSSPEWLVGKVMIKVEDHEFCNDPKVKQRNLVVLAGLISATSIVVMGTIILAIVKRFKVELHTYFNIHPFDRDECLGENMVYDAFISSSFADRHFSIDLIGFLESNGYRICYHEKDFIGGQTIAENICQAISTSKRVICHVTDSFIESTYCMYEFRRALHQNILSKKQRLIALVDESFVIERPVIPDDVYHFLTTHTYIEVKAINSWRKQLLYSLAVNKLGSQRNDRGPFD